MAPGGGPTCGFVAVGKICVTDQEPSAARASAWTRCKQWLGAIHLRLMTIEDTPHSIAMGLAIGVFFGFTPLLSLKTLLSIGVAWLLGSNKVAAAVSVQLHDLRMPVMPAIYLWEVKLGYWSMPGQRQPRVRFRLRAFDYGH